MVIAKFSGSYKSTVVNVELVLDMIDPTKDDNTTVMDIRANDTAAEQELFHAIKRIPSSKTALIAFATANDLNLLYDDNKGHTGVWYDAENSVSVSS